MFRSSKTLPTSSFSPERSKVTCAGMMPALLKIKESRAQNCVIHGRKPYKVSTFTNVGPVGHDDSVLWVGVMHALLKLEGLVRVQG